MTVPIETSKIYYDGTGSQDTFPYPFYILTDTDIVVVLTNAAEENTNWTLDNQYTITGAGNQSGGNVVVEAAYMPSASERLTIYREVDMKQETDYVENNPMHAEVIERNVDKLTMITQQLYRKTVNGVQILETDVGSALVIPSDRSDMLLGFDSGGDVELHPVSDCCNEAGVVGMLELKDDTTPQLGGDLDLNGYNITGLNIIDDTTPQLGGDLDANGKAIVAADHGIGTTSQVVNVIYETDDSPSMDADTTTIGTVWLKYVV